jgi:uncharacterized protein (TIGR02265 family)
MQWVVQISIITPGDNRYIVGSAVKTLLRGNGAAQRYDLHAMLFAKFQFNYDSPPVRILYDKYLEIIEFIRQSLYPYKTLEEGYEAMGVKLTNAHFEGALGQVNKVAAGLLGAERGYTIFIKNMTTTLPFGRHELEEIRKGYGRYHLYGVPGPAAFMRGIIRACLVAGGAKDIVVTTKILGTEEFIHEAFWK